MTARSERLVVGIVTWGSVALAALALATVAVVWAGGGGAIALPWVPTWRLQLSFALDGLAALYGLLTAAVGLAVLVYSARYIALHLAHEDRSPREQIRFYGVLLLFLASMLGLVTAQDLVLLVVFFDLTAIASYFLIGFDREDREARRAALMALVVTGSTSVLLLGAAIALVVTTGTASIPELAARDALPPGSEVLLGMAIVAALAKSAQVPLHFWLPRAMAAPTPVSAYLHSAAMVAAGVFLLERLYPLIQRSAFLPDALVVVGLASMLVGGVLALTQDVLKQLLAYSTIAQYGYVVFMLGLGGRAGLAGASFYVLAHGLAKSALFLTAGAVTEATGEDRLSRLGGLLRRQRLLAVASGVAAAGLAGLPLTIGFFKDELLFKAAAEAGASFVVLSVASAALTLAYSWRFWSGIFLGRAGDSKPVSMLLTGPIVVLAALVAIGGIAVGPAVRLAEAAGSVAFGNPTPVEAAYHFDLRLVNILALATYALGVLIVLSRRLWEAAATSVASLGERFGPARVYALAMQGLLRASTAVYQLEVRDMRDRVATILIPAGGLIGLALIGIPSRDAFAIGATGVADVPLLLALLLTAGAAVAAAVATHYAVVILAVSGSGYGLAVIFAVSGAPDVALVAVLINTVLTLLLIAILILFPRDEIERTTRLVETQPRRVRDDIAGIAAGAGVFIVVWGALSWPSGASVAAEHVRLAPAAHANDVVTVILADFRGLDTMGETTVLAVALLGILTLLGARAGRR